MKIEKFIYGLTQSSNIANYKLKQNLSKFGYETSPITPSLWWHQTQPIQCSLVLDGFDVKYDIQADINHLLEVPKQIYNISEDWEGNIYCELISEWKYSKWKFLVSMKNYVT